MIISTMMRLIGYKLSDEQWEQRKVRSCVMCDEDMDGPSPANEIGTWCFCRR